MLRTRWSIGIVALTIVGALVAAGALIQPTAAARPPLQDATPTVTETATEAITSTATITATEATITPTESVTPTETETPIATVAATSTPGPLIQGRFWSFAVKFVCGEATNSATSGEPSLRPGSYATEINIHNPNYRGPVLVFKKALLLIDRGEPVGREPNTVEPRALSGPIKLANDAATMDDCASIWELENPGVPAPTPMPLMVGYLVLLSPRDLDVVSVTTAGATAIGQTPGAVAIDTLVVQGKRVTIPPSAFPEGAFPSPEEFADQP